MKKNLVNNGKKSLTDNDIVYKTVQWLTDMFDQHCETTPKNERFFFSLYRGYVECNAQKFDFENDVDDYVILSEFSKDVVLQLRKNIIKKIGDMHIYNLPVLYEFSYPYIHITVECGHYISEYYQNKSIAGQNKFKFTPDEVERLLVSESSTYNNCVEREKNEQITKLSEKYERIKHENIEEWKEPRVYKYINKISMKIFLPLCLIMFILSLMEFASCGLVWRVLISLVEAVFSGYIWSYLCAIISVPIGYPIYKRMASKKIPQTITLLKKKHQEEEERLLNKCNEVSSYYNDMIIEVIKCQSITENNNT